LPRIQPAFRCVYLLYMVTASVKLIKRTAGIIHVAESKPKSSRRRRMEKKKQDCSCGPSCTAGRTPAGSVRITGHYFAKWRAHTMPPLCRCLSPIRSIHSPPPPQTFSLATKQHERLPSSAFASRVRTNNPLGGVCCYFVPVRLTHATHRMRAAHSASHVN
jgi:hypothetical protein